MFKPFHAVAHNLVGFSSSSLRVIVTRQQGDYCWVTTADLQDVGTKLVLDRFQVVPEEDTTTVVRHPAGLVSIFPEVDTPEEIADAEAYYRLIAD